MELNVYGEYAQGPWRTPKEIVAAANSNRDEWFPGKLELRQMASSGAGVVEGAPNVWNLLCLIVRYKPARVNIFTHATSGYIGMSGTVVKGNVYFAKSPAAEFGPETINEAGEDGFTFSDAKTKGATMGDVHQALGTSSQIVVYACHSGSDTAYLKRLAKLLRTKVGGFDQSIRFYPTLSRDQKSLDWQYSTGGAKVRDFHGLTPTFVSE